MPAGAQHRKNIIKEIVSTEVTYTESLRLLEENFRAPLRQGNIITPEQDHLIFLNGHSILELHVPLLEKLQAAWREAEEEDQVDNL